MGTKDRILAGALIASVVFALGVLIFVVTTPKEGEHFTEFYILSPGGNADDYPETLRAGVPETLIMGVVNHENQAVTYRVEARLEKEPSDLLLSTEGDGAEAIDGRSFRIRDLPDEGTWEHPIEVTALKPRELQKLEFLIFSPLPRDGYYLRSLLMGCGTAVIELHESDGEAKVTLNGGDSSFHDMRIEAWQNGGKVAELPMHIDVDEEKTWTFEFPAAETQFRLYDGDYLVLDDSGAELTLHLWVDVHQ